jgi:hypothetical protein
VPAGASTPRLEEFVAAVAHTAPRSLLGKLTSAVAGGRGRRIAALAAAAAREHLPTAAGLTAICYGAFSAAAAAGWIVTGVSLLVFEWKVRD